MMSDMSLEFSKVYPLTNDMCVVAYKYLTEGRYYWKAYDITSWTELHTDECIPSYDVDNDTFTYCTQEVLQEKQDIFDNYLMQLSSFSIVQN